MKRNFKKDFQMVSINKVMKIEKKVTFEQDDRKTST